MTLRPGIVLERDGSVYRVQTPDGEVRAILRGKAKQGKRDQSRVVVGDRVLLDETGDELLGIESVEPRTTLLGRRVPEGRGTRPVAANVDRVFVVTATANPEPIPSLLDRLLVVAESNEIPAALIVNKIDLDPGSPLIQRFTQAGYPIFPVSVKTGEGLDTLREELTKQVVVVTGPSGAGKSSLLNALEPGLMLRVGAVSKKIGRGTNTTVGAVMVPLALGGFLVDTPGFSEVGLWGIDPRELAACFPEFRPLLGECRFGDCRHMTEPGCAITAAVAEGTVGADRLDGYRQLLKELESEPRDWE